MKYAPLYALAFLLCASVSLVSLLFLPPTPGVLGLATIVKAPIEAAALATGVTSPEVWDDSPAVLGERTKTRGCTIEGPYPDPACTPGAVFASTTLDVLCVEGYTKSVRAVSTKLKQQVYIEYGISYPQPTGTYEADHFIPLGLGGNNDISNLFPEAAAPTPGFKEKDIVENYLRGKVCSGAMPLPRAQEAIAHDWVAVYHSIPPAELRALRSKYASWADKN